MAKKKQFRAHDVFPLARQMEQDRWWKCRQHKCLFSTPGADLAAEHRRATGHVVDRAAPAQSSPRHVPVVPEPSSAAKALKDAQTINEAVQDLRMWVDALAVGSVDLDVTPGTLNELLICTTRVGTALDEAAPAADELVMVLRKVERRERDATAREAERVEADAERRAELAMSDDADEVGHD